MMILLFLTGCQDIEEFDNNAYGNFDALWTIMDEHYCFFEEKGVDWKAVGEKYRSKVRSNMTQRELFVVCSDMLKELKDGHTNLVSSWDVSYYNFWKDYPQNYNQRIVEENYLNYNFKQSCGVKYMILPNNFAYMYYGDFSYSFGEGNLDNIFIELGPSDGLIIDVRDNGGGYLLNVEKLVSRLINERIYAGAISHKTGPGHDEFSEPFDYYFDAAKDERVRYMKPVVILTNRSSYSATNNFASIMQYRDNVKIVGDYTGGGSGLPFTSELPNGWGVRFSACSILDPKGNVTEFGVAPSEDCKIDITAEDMAAGKDPILEKGYEELQKMINKQKTR